MDTIRKPEFIEHLNEKGLTREQATLAFNEIFELIAENLALGNEVQVTGFGKFTTTTRPARTRNVFGTERNIPERRVASFKPGKTLRDIVNDEELYD